MNCLTSNFWRKLMKIFGNLIGFSYNYTVLPQESLDPPKKGVGFSKPPVTWEAYTIFEKGVRLLYSILDFIDWFSLRWFNQPFFLWNIRSVVKLAILSVYLSINLDNISDLSCHKTFDYVHFIMDNMSLNDVYFICLPKLSCCHPKQFPGNPG